jgi:formylglycine-generating enzyme required for sulfatase activity
MAGNVWEWTHTPWTENHDPPRSTEVADGAKRFTLKMGGYSDNRILVRCAARNWDIPGYDIDGFRVLLSPRGSA